MILFSLSQNYMPSIYTFSYRNVTFNAIDIEWPKCNKNKHFTHSLRIVKLDIFYNKYSDNIIII